MRKEDIITAILLKAKGLNINNYEKVFIDVLEIVLEDLIDRTDSHTTITKLFKADCYYIDLKNKEKAKEDKLSNDTISKMIADRFKSRLVLEAKHI